MGVAPPASAPLDAPREHAEERPSNPVWPLSSSVDAVFGVAFFCVRILMELRQLNTVLH